MMTWFRNNFLYIALLLVICLYTFADIKDVFYQQDEWHALGFYFSQNSFWDLFNVSFLRAILGEGRIFSSIIGYLLLGVFPFENFPLALYGLVFHCLNSLLVFQLGLKLTGKKGMALISAVFFIVCSVSAGTVSWYSTSIGTLPATSLILLTVLFFWNGLTGKHKYLILAVITLYLSQPFKEIGYFLFLSLPFCALLYQKLNFKSWLKKYWYYLATFLLITIYRITQLSTYSSESAVFTQVSSHNFFLTIILRALLYPFTSFSLIFVPPEFLIRAAKVFTNHYYPFFPTEHYNLIVESAILDLLAITLTFALILFTIFISIKVKTQIKKNIIFTVVLIVSTFLPYVILSKAYAYLDARYYYLAAAFSGILFGFLVMNTLNLLKNRLFKFIIFLFAGFYLLWLSQNVKLDLHELAQLSIQRKSLLNQLSQLKPTLGKRNIFYVIGDRHYYLAHDNYVPFQQGFGYTALVWLNRDNDQFKQLLKDEVLWDLGSQGYFESESGGFGYFWDKELFLKTLKEKNLSLEDADAFYYDSKLGKLNRIKL